MTAPGSSVSTGGTIARRGRSSVDELPALVSFAGHHATSRHTSRSLCQVRSHTTRWNRP
jgi:hypothetical protein